MKKRAKVIREVYAQKCDSSGSVFNENIEFRNSNKNQPTKYHVRAMKNASNIIIGIICSNTDSNYDLDKSLIDIDKMVEFIKSSVDIKTYQNIQNDLIDIFETVNKKNPSTQVTVKLNDINNNKTSEMEGK